MQNECFEKQKAARNKDCCGLIRVASYEILLIFDRYSPEESQQSAAHSLASLPDHGPSFVSSIHPRISPTIMIRTLVLVAFVAAVAAQTAVTPAAKPANATTATAAPAKSAAANATAAKPAAATATAPAATAKSAAVPAAAVAGAAVAQNGNVAAALPASKCGACKSGGSFEVPRGNVPFCTCFEREATVLL
jgi:hypothetical protein